MTYKINPNAHYVSWDQPVAITTSASYICPDLLELDDIGAADNVRGRVVRAFFWLMRFWKP